MVMDIVDWMQGLAWLACPMVAYLLIFKKTSSRRNLGPYSETYWNFFLKKWWAMVQLPRLVSLAENSLASKGEEDLEKPRPLLEEENVDGISIFGMDAKGNRVHVKMTHKRHRTVELWLHIQLDNGKIYQLPNHPDTVVHNSSSQTWTAGGLVLQMCDPLRKWRLSFNGLLRCGNRTDWSDQEGGVFEHVRFSFIWSACSRPMDLQADWSRYLKSHALAREPWRDGEWQNLTVELGNGYEQWGTLYGTFTIGNSDAKVIHVRGIRQRLWGDDQVIWQHRRLSIIGVAENGMLFSLLAVSSRHGLTHAVFGQIREPEGNQLQVDWCDISLADIGEHRDSIPRHLVVRFSAGGRYYTTVIDFQPQYDATYFGGQPWNQEVRVKPFQCAINSQQGVGVAEFWYRYSGPSPTISPPSCHLLSETRAQPGPLAVAFDDRECKDSKIVGGKGASLALMASYQNNQFNVPPGFCLTASALESQLKECEELQKAIDRLDQISCRQLSGDLKQQCEATVKLIEETPICDSVSNAVTKHLRLLDTSLPLAIRSSGIGEDSEDLSAAGQNATILGEQHSNIMSGVAKCWASLFTYQSVQYRRQHGQEVQSGMGVVVQVMVAAESAGVLFTRHPMTGDPTRMVITANYGLGESVVSALVEPDTIILDRDWKDNLSVNELQCGSKMQRVTMEANGEVITKEVSSDEMSLICVTPEEALALGAIGVQLEHMFQGPRDIEWAILQGKIYLLQARPITSLNSWSDFDLLHESDSPVMIDQEVLTIANTGEVFPGATSPLTESWIIRALDQSVIDGTIAENTNRGQSYFLNNIAISHHHVMLNVLNTMMSAVESKITISNRVADLSVYGHEVTTTEIHRLGMERNGVVGFRKKMGMLYLMGRDAMKSKAAMKEAIAISDSFKLDAKSYTSAAALYAAITDCYSYLHMAGRCHSHTSRVSTTSQIVTMTVLMEGQEEFTVDHFSDISLLLSSCLDIVSAGVPKALEELSNSIAETGHGPEFSTLPPGTVLEWLDKNHADIAEVLHNFLKKHEHRAIREFDLLTETWGMKPETVIVTLQAMVGASGNQRKAKQALHMNKNTELRSPKKSGTRVVLKWLMSWCQSAVARREETKASIIAVVHQFRLGFRQLGELLVNEGRIPDADLVFFFTYYELGVLLKSRDATLLNKASRRKRLLSQWDQLSFPEIMRGIPEPIKVGSSSAHASTVRLQGTGVCQGTVMGRACVITKLEEIGQLEAGDILITHSTDIGWSPYFPLLGGVVTELGGLISHGAVVAREYGLPCIVGAQNATSIFQTGDMVMLVGSAGTLEKITNAEELSLSL